MFAIEDKFGAERQEYFTELGNKICLVCDMFGGGSSVNSGEITLEFKWKVCAQSLDPYHNISTPTLFDYKYQEIAGVAQGIKSYSNLDKRVDLQIINGTPQPKFEQAKDDESNLMYFPELDENGGIVVINDIVQYTTNPIMMPVMIGNIDFWLKFGGQAILQDLKFTLGQISISDISTFIKL